MQLPQCSKISKYLKSLKNHFETVLVHRFVRVGLFLVASAARLVPIAVVLSLQGVCFDVPAADRKDIEVRHCNAWLQRPVGKTGWRGRGRKHDVARILPFPSQKGWLWRS